MQKFRFLYQIYFVNRNFRTFLYFCSLLNFGFLKKFFERALASLKQHPYQTTSLFRKQIHRFYNLEISSLILPI